MPKKIQKQKLPPAPQTFSADVIVLGTGAAGLATALNLAPLRVLLLTKTPTLTSGSTAIAQGGIAAAYLKGDNAEKHSADTHFAGAGLNTPAAVTTLTHGGASVIEDLLSLGMPFERTPEGGLHCALEAAHSAPRVFHAGGDNTGHHLTQTLIKAVGASRHIQTHTNTFGVDLITQKEGPTPHVCGLWAYNTKTGTYAKFMAPHVVLATGGCGQLYNHTTNPTESTGDGQALAYRAGAVLVDMEFTQFHPTALAAPTKNNQKPLLTEALRGAGAYLVDQHEQRFLKTQHPMAELAPRDIVARSIWAELCKASPQNPNPVYLDGRHIPHVAARFPTVNALCAAHGLDLSQDLIPVTPAAHYHMGGVAATPQGATSLAGLWAVGEVAATGLHGANRLASNSLLECLVFAKEAAAAIQVSYPSAPQQKATAAPPSGPTPPPPAACTKEELQVLMYTYGGVVRTKEGVEQGLKLLKAFAQTPPKKRLQNTAKITGETLELYNMLTIAPLFLKAALLREESRGSHYRQDHQNQKEEYKKHIYFKLKNNKPHVLKEDKKGAFNAA